MAAKKDIDIDSIADTEHEDAHLSRSSKAIDNEAMLRERSDNRTAKEKALAKGLQKIERHVGLHSSAAIRSAAGTSHAIISGSQSTLGSQNLGAMSVAAKQAMEHMDRIFTCDTREEERGFLKYVEKVNMIPIHRLSPEELLPCQLNAEQWSLIKLAADMSKQVYADENTKTDPGIEVYNLLRSNPDMKPTTITALNHEGKKTLVVSIRGTVTTNDWLLNVNGDPVVSQDLGTSIRWHKGFLKITLDDMQPNIARYIGIVAAKTPGLEQIIFTGHSAGGAIAQILYALSMQENSAIARAIQPFPIVHCITFAAPPVSDPPIAPDPAKHAAHIRGHFFAVINEGDPVPLAQEAYILTLLDVYGKTSAKLQEEDRNQFRVPEPVMKLSGDCILLRDENPESADGFDICAYSATAGLLQSKLFGNPLEHFMIEYQARIYKVMDLESPLGKEIDIDL